MLPVLCLLALGAGRAEALTAANGAGQEDPCSGWKLELLRAGADAGVPDAQFEIGRIAWEGICGPLDPEFAADRLLKAAEAGHRGAGLLLGDIHFSGVTATGSAWMAERFVEVAARSGHVRARQALGLSKLLAARTGAERQAGMDLLHRAAAQGSGFAAAILGMFHQRGMHGTVKDECRAAAWYEKAVRLGFTDLTPAQQALSRSGARLCRTDGAASLKSSDDR